MLLRITAKRQITIPLHVLDQMGVAQATGCNSYQAPPATSSVHGASTTRAYARCRGRFRTSIHRFTSTHSATGPTTWSCETDSTSCRS